MKRIYTTKKIGSPVRWNSDFDFASDEPYLTGNTGIWDGDNGDAPEEEWRSGEDYGEDE